MPKEIINLAPASCQKINSAKLSFSEIMSAILTAVKAGKTVVRLHSGDPAVYGAINEQIDFLTDQGVIVEVVPGVTAALAAAAALKRELTAPEITQTIIFTRMPGRTSVPETEQLSQLAKVQCTLCLYLSVEKAQEIQEQLQKTYPPTTPVAIASKVSQPEQEVINGTLQELAELVKEHNLKRTALIIVSPALGRLSQRSRLYAAEFSHSFRKGKNANSSNSS